MNKCSKCKKLLEKLKATLDPTKITWSKDPHFSSKHAMILAEGLPIMYFPLCGGREK